MNLGKIQRCLDRLEQVAEFLEDEDLRFTAEIVRDRLNKEAAIDETNILEWEVHEGNAYAIDPSDTGDPPTLFGAPVRKNGIVDSELIYEVVAIEQEQLNLVNSMLGTWFTMKDFPGR